MIEYWDMYEIRRACADGESRHWFDPDSMRFFRTRIGSIYRGPGGVYFTTSETPDHETPRRYSVRRFDPARGAIDTMGEFRAYDTSRAARAAARKLAAGN